MKTLHFLDKNLTLWVFCSMGIGIGIGFWSPQFPAYILDLSIGDTNIPIAIGLIIMMYPPLTKVNYRLLPLVVKDFKILSVSLFLNWVIGPTLMFVLALFFLNDYPHYMIGLILIGLARCIAMVLVWNDLSDGNSEYAAALVALNTLFQVFLYGFYAWLFISFLPSILGQKGMDIDIPIRLIVQSVSLYLGLPFLLGIVSRWFVIRYWGEQYFRERFVPFISPMTLIALLFTIIVMFSLKGEHIINLPKHVFMIALPLLIYFGLMFVLGYIGSKFAKADYKISTAVAFTASGNNFELAIAVAIAIFGINSGEAFVGVVGPLVEVPILIFLVKVAKRIRLAFYIK